MLLSFSFQNIAKDLVTRPGLIDNKFEFEQEETDPSNQDYRDIKIFGSADSVIWIVYSDSALVILRKFEDAVLEKVGKIRLAEFLPEATIGTVGAFYHHPSKLAKREYFVLVGSDQGKLFVFNLNGQLLFSSAHAQSPIKKILMLNNSDNTNTVELFLCHGNGTIVVIEAISLAQWCSTHSIASLETSSPMSAIMKRGHALVHKTLSFPAVKDVVDVVLFENLAQAELQQVVVVFSTKESFVQSFKIHRTPIAPPPYSMTNIANKLSTAVSLFASNWFSSPSPQPVAVLPLFYSNAMIEAYFSLPRDGARMIEDMDVSSCQLYLICADSLGRVLLIDLCSKYIVKLWKGYRHSSVQFMRVRACLYIVIHCRKRSMIEIWDLKSSANIEPNSQVHLSSQDRLVKLDHPYHPYILFFEAGKCQAVSDFVK